MKYFLPAFIILFSSTHLFAQYEIEEIIDHYNKYNEQHEQVRVHLEFNQTKYAPGDTAYFKAYFLTYQFRPIKGSQFITVQILDSHHNRVHLQNVKIVDGKTSNHILLSNKLSPGNYVIEAFSDWMKNFDDQFRFRMPIVLAGKKKPLAETKTIDAVSLFSEGGKLIADVPNSVLVTSSQLGRGVIRKANGEQVGEFEVGAAGIAKFSFKPSSGESYFLQMDGADIKSELYTPQRDGCALQVISLGECSPLQLHITTPAQSSLRNSELYLIATAYGKVTYSKAFTLTEAETTPVLVPYRSLHDGLNQIFILDKTGALIAERNYFLSPMYSQVEINIEDGEIFPRDSLEVQIRLTDFFGNPIKGEFSASVINKKLFDEERPIPSLRNEMYLFNDLPKLRSHFHSAKVSEADWMKEINDILIAHESERSSWEKILQKDRMEKLAPFKKSLSFSGRMLFKDTNEPIPDSTLVSIIQEKSKIVYSTHTKKDGYFEFSLINDFWNVDKFYYRVALPESKNRQPDYYLESDMIHKTFEPVDVTFSEMPDDYGMYVSNKRIIDKSFDIYLSKIGNVSQSDIKDPNAHYLEAGAPADVEITIGDFVIFPTMGDLIHEVVEGLQYRKSNGMSTIRVPIFSAGYTKLPPGDPLYIINGIFTEDTNKFLALKPDEIVYIKLINDQNRLSKFGSFGRNGVVMVLTKEKDINEQTLNSHSFELAGINKEISFKKRIPTGQFAPSVPILSSTLQWLPNVSTDAKGKATVRLKLTDDLGPMQINVSGVTFDGSPFSGKTVFIVKRPGLNIYH